MAPSGPAGAACLHLADSLTKASRNEHSRAWSGQRCQQMNNFVTCNLPKFDTFDAGQGRVTKQAIPNQDKAKLQVLGSVPRSCLKLALSGMAGPKASTNGQFRALNSSKFGLFVACQFCTRLLPHTSVALFLSLIGCGRCRANDVKHKQLRALKLAEIWHLRSKPVPNAGLFP